MRLTVTSILCFAPLAVAACTALDPEVGAFRGNCTGESEYGPPTGVTGDGYSRCAPGSGTAHDACGECENANCCGPRFACYDDQICLCADQALDECLEDGDDPASDCYEAFLASGKKAKDRVACLRAACAEACAVPEVGPVNTHRSAPDR